MPDPITAIEQAYNFELPALYKRLYHDGMLDWGNAQPNWHANVFPLLRKKPPMLLFAQDFELYAPETVPALLLEQEDWGSAYQFVPLGHTGGGDLYAFCPTLATNGETPITLSRHDSNETTVLAPSLAAFIFREMLARATSFDEYDLAGYAGFEDLRADLQRAAQSISPYLKPEWNTLLAEVYARPLRQETVVLPRRQYTIDALLPEAEFEETVRREMPFEHLDHTFEHFPE
ncbi:SMI1/KNR4 family protein [Hymenobacter actinosclerus]|uniref:SMI1 / KNR4 family (SUKH-1) n=1 Tax=Hymenobacter actinosclerus TaxID=82805 RepID=A0A1I0DZ27_9BACT|nr:SMI1/KNR4 family protein [Hymenobacter actinosclerus]SET37114.1 SMI1 / KNR4 family (SUKH-1) [Hymenobacter actinosclerus]